MIPELETEWPVDECEQVTACPTCNGTERRLLHHRLRDHLFSAQGVWNLHACSTCGSAYLDPRPTPQSIGRAYSSYYTHANSNATGLLRQLSRRARNGYINRYWNAELKPASAALGAIVACIPAMKAKVDHELMRGFKHSPTHQLLLDVGCGSGQFLFLIKHAGWQVKGIDFDPQAVVAARQLGLDVDLGGLDILSGQQDAFDAITLSHVIEHVYDPADALKQCFRLLRSGGTLWIETPNLESTGHSLYGRNWRGLEPPRHLVLFTWLSLKSLLEQAGFIGIEPAPWRPEFKPLAIASRQIAASDTQGAPNHYATDVAVETRHAEAKARKLPESREFITFTARKP